MAQAKQEARALVSCEPVMEASARRARTVPRFVVGSVAACSLLGLLVWSWSGGAPEGTTTARWLPTAWGGNPWMYRPRWQAPGALSPSQRVYGNSYYDDYRNPWNSRRQGRTGYSGRPGAYYPNDYYYDQPRRNLRRPGRTGYQDGWAPGGYYPGSYPGRRGTDGYSNDRYQYPRDAQYRPGNTRQPGRTGYAGGATPGAYQGSIAYTNTYPYVPPRRPVRPSGFQGAAPRNSPGDYPGSTSAASEWGYQGSPMGGLPEDSTIHLQGGTLRTWSYYSPAVENVQVILSTEGSQLDAEIELWQGQDNVPSKMRVYSENGLIRPFSVVIATPANSTMQAADTTSDAKTVAIRNIGPIELPFAANVFAHEIDTPSHEAKTSLLTMQGGDLRTYPVQPDVDSVQVLIETDGRPLNAKIELIHGPEHTTQVIELYSEQGTRRPFFCILETPESNNVVRIMNSSPIDFPMTASVVPSAKNTNRKPYVGGGTDRSGEFGRY